MTADKLKQYVAMIGGFLGALYLFLSEIGVELEWFNVDSIGAFGHVLDAAIPLVLVIYGIWKNTYIVTPKAKKQERVLVRNGLK